MKPPGSEVGLFMDTRNDIDVGDEIVTRTGRRYLVVKTRRQQRGAHVGRWHLRCVVRERDAIHDDPDARVHMLWWYSR